MIKIETIYKVTGFKTYVEARKHAENNNRKVIGYGYCARNKHYYKYKNPTKSSSKSFNIAKITKIL